MLQALPASADLFRNLHLYILWQLACISLGSLFPQTGTVFRNSARFPGCLPKCAKCQALSCCPGTQTQTGNGLAFKVLGGCRQGGNTSILGRDLVQEAGRHVARVSPVEGWPCESRTVCSGFVGVRHAMGSRGVGSGLCPLGAWQSCPEGCVSPRCPLAMQLASGTWADPQTPFGRSPLGLESDCRPNGLQVSLTESQSRMAAGSLAVHVVGGLWLWPRGACGLKSCLAYMGIAKAVLEMPTWAPSRQWLLTFVLNLKIVPL